MKYFHTVPHAQEALFLKQSGFSQIRKMFYLKEKLHSVKTNHIF